MKKKILLFVAISTMIIGCSGCGNTVTPSINVSDANYQVNAEDDQFLRIDSIDGWIYVDKETKCQYLWVKRGYGGGITLLVNEDGTPKLYE